METCVKVTNSEVCVSGMIPFPASWEIPLFSVEITKCIESIMFTELFAKQLEFMFSGLPSYQSSHWNADSSQELLNAIRRFFQGETLVVTSKI